VSARLFLSANTNAARVWSEMLVETADGFRPAFDRDDMIASVREGETIQDYRDDWRRIACPIRIIVGEAGWMGREPEQMIDLNARATIDVISGAGHDVHLDAPELWRSSAEQFLRGEERER
jgi:pimeloyl-ACP methyl ester carboxylesterase